MNFDRTPGQVGYDAYREALCGGCRSTAICDGTPVATWWQLSAAVRNAWEAAFAAARLWECAAKTRGGVKARAGA